MTLTLYYSPLSSPSRAILSFLNLTRIQYKKKSMDILQAELKSPEYLKINPYGAVPAIQDDNFSLFEPEAIIKYLMNSRKVGEEYYPSDPKVRAQVDKYMPFYFTAFRPRLNQYFLATYAAFMSATLTTEQARPGVEEALKIFQEKFLKDKAYIAGDQLTIADLFAVSELAIVSLTTDFDFNKFPDVKQYISRCLMDPVINEVNDPLRVFAKKMKPFVQKVEPVKEKKRFMRLFRAMRQG